MTRPTSRPIPRSDTDDADRATRDAAGWSDVEELLADGSGTTWLTVPKEGGVHTRPVFAAWTGSAFVFATSPDAVKTRHLRTADAVSLAIDLSTIHLVVEGVPSRVTGRSGLEHASRAMRDVYDWPTEVTGELLDAPYAAPTAGGPPFEAWEVTPTRALAFPTQDQVEPTRFDFGAPGASDRGGPAWDA